MKPLILGSSSPFRREILGKLGVPFTTRSPEVDETPLPGEQPEALVQRLALIKATAVAEHNPDSLIIASDQVSVLDEIISGKPGNHRKAIEQLTKCSGKTVTFYTGLCLYDTTARNYQLDCELFKVHFKTLTDRMIENYVNREKPYQCAGSFKSEGLGITLINALEGRDPNALIGLPLIRLTEMLALKGMALP